MLWLMTVFGLLRVRSGQGNWVACSRGRPSAGSPHPGDSQLLVLVENLAVAVDLVFHAGCWYSLISPASLGRSWIRLIGTGKGSTSGMSSGVRRPMPWRWWLRPVL